MNAPLFAVLTVIYLLLMAALVVLALYNTVAGWLSRRELRRLKAQERAEIAALQHLAQQADPLPPVPSSPRIYYLPLGRAPMLPPIMALPPYDTGGNLPPGLPTYPGDLPALPVLPDDLYPLCEQEFDAVVLGALERLGEW